MTFPNRVHDGWRHVKLKIFHKLFLALLLTTGAALVLMAILLQRSLDRGFLDYVNQLAVSQQDQVVERLQILYESTGDWEWLRHDHGFWNEILSGRDNMKPEPSSFNEFDDRQRRTRRRPPPREDYNGLPPGGGEGPPPRDDFQDDFFAGGRDDRQDDNYRGRAGEGRRRPPPRRPRDNDDPIRRPPPDPFGTNSRLTVYDADYEPVIGAGPPPPELTLRPIIVNDATVGYLGIAPMKQVTAPRELNFLQRQSRTFVFVTLGMLMLAVLISAMLARHLRKPTIHLAEASRKLTAGAFNTRVRVETDDEIGQLARDFNNLAHSLERNEKARQRWIADISHELRTPLAVLRGEVEALQDGVRKVDQHTLGSLHAEVMCLSKIVDDLYELALSDIGSLNYRKLPVDPASVIASAVSGHAGRLQESGLTLNYQPNLRDTDPIQVLGDEQRLYQLFSNLLENSRRYTDPGGTVRITTEVEDHYFVTAISDSAPAVPKEAYPRLFERLFRVEGSRSRKKGGAGLGLSICKNIVEAHDGTITAGPSDLGGLTMRIAIPLARS